MVYDSNNNFHYKQKINTSENTSENTNENINENKIIDSDNTNENTNENKIIDSDKNIDNQNSDNKYIEINSKNVNKLNIPNSIRNMIAEILYFRNFDGICDNDEFYEYADTFNYLNVDKCLDNWTKNSKFTFLTLLIKNSENDNNITLRVFKRKINDNKKNILIIYDGNPIFIYKINNAYNEFYICNKIEINSLQIIMKFFKIINIFNILVENYPTIKYYTKKNYETIVINNYNGYINITETIDF